MTYLCREFVQKCQESKCEKDLIYAQGSEG